MENRWVSLRGVILLGWIALVPGWVLAGLAAAEPSSQPATGTAASQPIKLQLHWEPQAQFAGYMIAKEQGFFDAAGAPGIELHWTAAGEKPLERVAKGEIDFCTGWLCDAMVERDQGRRLVNIAQIAQDSSMLLVAWRKSGIAKPADLDGKRVGMWGGNHDVLSTAFFRKMQVKPVAIPQSTSIVAFLRRAVDVASAMQYNEYHKLLEAGVRPEDLQVFSLADHGFHIPEDGLYCCETTRRRRARLCAAMATACRRGWEYAAAHETETLEMVMRYCRKHHVKTNMNHQRWMLRAFIKVTRSDAAEAAWGWLPETVYRDVGAELESQKLISRTPPYREFYQPPDKLGATDR